jgi:hypothetical protein
LCSASFFHSFLNNQVLGLPGKQICDQVLLARAVVKNVPERSQEFTPGGLARIQHSLDGEILEGLMVRINLKKGPAEHQQGLPFLERTHDSQQFLIMNKVIAFSGAYRFRIKRHGMPIFLIIQLELSQNNAVLDTCLSMINVITGVHSCDGIVKKEIKKVEP